MKLKKVLVRGGLIALLATALITLFAITTIYGGGGKKRMEPLYQVNNPNALTPQIYRIGDMSGLSLFPVPHDNAVGTNDYANAITIISFPKGKMDIDKYFKGAADNIRGGGTYLPVISPDMIGFGQMRRFLLYNFKTKKCEDFDIVISLNDSIEKIAIADGPNKRFIFEIEEQNPRSVDHRDFTKSLRLIDLSDNKVNMIKKFEKGKGSIWAVSFNKLFLWFFDEKEIQVYDMNMEPSSHPMGDVIKLHSKKQEFRFNRIWPHSDLPFAILSGGKYGSIFISWNKDTDNNQFNLFGNNIETNNFSFSPDGNWVAFTMEDFEKDTKKTYLMPVSEKYPNYLGTPILLFDRSFTNNHYTWTKNPVSFVGSYGDRLYRWELTNEVHPESDKPTFHDYIVEKDLERLAREKNQDPEKDK